MPACLIFSACGLKSPHKEKPVAVKGVIDLRGWNFERDGAVDLNGEWEFCWNRILTPADFKNHDSRTECSYAPVPGLWKNLSVNGAALPGKGHATYRLTLISDPDDRPKALVIRKITSAYKLWINGALADRKGTDVPLKTREDYIYIHNKRLSSFTLRPGANEIIIKVFNRDYESGGIDKPVRLNDDEVTARREFLLHTIDIFIVGILLLAAIYNMLFYFSQKADTASLYFGIFYFFMGINIFNHQFPLFPDILAGIGHPFLVNYISAILAVTISIMGIRALFPDEFAASILRGSQLFGAGCVVILLFIDQKKSESLMSIYFIFMLAILFYDVFVFAMAIKNRRKGAIIFLAGFTLVLIGGINDTLYALWIVDTAVVTHYALIVLCIVTMYIISRRFSSALRKVEDLSEDLSEKNIALRKMDMLKDQFLANTSHELRTPLHGMIGLSESMIAGASGSLPPKAVENLSLIASSGHRLAGMVNDLLDMAKIQDRGLALNLRPVDLRSLGEMVLKLSLPLAGGKALEMVNGIRPDFPRAWADEDRIRQVLHNLVGNAIKFTNRGMVALSARLVPEAGAGDPPGSDAMIEVSVADTGIGVPEEYRERIFEAYRQVDGSDTRSYGGTGLGLAIAKKIIELHNGEIALTSGENGGSIFAFTLPVSPETGPEAPQAVVIESMNDAAPGDGPPPLSRLPAGIGAAEFENEPVFLVVDDDPVNVKVVQNCFESVNCVVKTAPDGISALDMIERDGSIGLVLLDIMMPVMSGYEVCRRIRLTRTPEELPVIMLTAKNAMSDIDAAFEAGANDYIVKPFQISELLARAGTMLKLRKVMRSAAEGITIRDRGMAHSLKFGEIIYITSHQKSVVIHMTERDLELPVLIKEILDRLPPDLFVRIHKSHVINIRFLRSISHVASGRYSARLRDRDDTELPVGRAFVEGLKKKL